MNTIPDIDVLEHFDSWMNDYMLIAFHFDKIHKKTIIGQNTGRCRFCKKSVPEVSFKKDAHAFPQFIGNNFLLSSYECDVCNERFSRTLENEMANFMKPLHTVFGVKGKKRIPIYKNKGSRFESDGSKLLIKNFDHSILVGNLEDNKFSMNLITDKFIPIALYKCLTKMALSIMPEIEIHFFNKTLDWLQEEDHSKTSFKLDNLWVIYSQLLNEHKFPHMSATLLKKKQQASSPFPNYIFRLTYSKFSFQIYLPLCDIDFGKTFSIQNLNYFPHLIDITTGLDASEKIFIDCTSKEKCEIPIIMDVNNLDHQ